MKVLGKAFLPYIATRGAGYFVCGDRKPGEITHKTETNFKHGFCMPTSFHKGNQMGHTEAVCFVGVAFFGEVDHGLTMHHAPSAKAVFTAGHPDGASQPAV